MTNWYVQNEREPAIVYQTISGWTYRVLDRFDHERFGGEYETKERAIDALYEDGYYLAEVC